MGFLFDSLSNMVGDIQCGLISLDSQISESMCDDYTHASGSSSASIKSNHANATKKVETKKYIGEINDAIKKLDLKSENKTSGNDKKVTNQKMQQAGKRAFDIAFPIIANACGAESANIIANVIASTVIDNDPIKDITLEKILVYCDNAKIPEPATVMAMREFKKLNVDQIAAAIDNADIYSAAEETVIQKPFMMDFSKYTNPAVMVG